MIRCDYCLKVFEEPMDKREYLGSLDGQPMYEVEKVCPYCQKDRFTEVEECPVCGGWMPDGYHICDKCCKRLSDHLAVCLDVLEPAELDQLDEWLDGTSIKEYRRFK